MSWNLDNLNQINEISLNPYGVNYHYWQNGELVMSRELDQNLDIFDPQHPAKRVVT